MKKRISKRRFRGNLQAIWKRLKSNTILLSFATLVIAFIAFIFLSIIINVNWKEFLSGIHVELFGIIFDILILIILFNWIRQKGERESKIEGYKEELEDFKKWTSDEAKFRKIGIIKRLNKLNVTNLILSYTDISGYEKQNGSMEFENVNLTNSIIQQAKFNFCNFHGSILSKIFFFSVQMKNGNFCGANFNGSRISYVNFSNSLLCGAYFKNTKLDNVNFDFCDFRITSLKGVTEINNLSFRETRVDKDFVTKLKGWGIKDLSFLDNLCLVKIKAIPRHYGYWDRKSEKETMYYLVEKSKVKQFNPIEIYEINQESTP